MTCQRMAAAMNRANKYSLIPVIWVMDVFTLSVPNARGHSLRKSQLVHTITHLRRPTGVRMKLSHFAILALVMPIGLAAQQPPATPPANPITAAFRARISALH